MSGSADSQAIVDQAAASPPPETPAPPGGLGGFLQGILTTAAEGMAILTNLEQQLTAPLGKIPFPALPALRVLDAEIGLPHGHYHPPNLIPPIIPVPLPLPSIGVVLPIPFLSGAKTVNINGRSAARCGDMGIGAWCGSFFPLFQIFLGSANVWIEGQRAGRVGVDVTTHCIFAAPRPQDPPCYPWVGFPVTGSGNVVIGGIPLPSLTNLAIQLGMKIIFSGVSSLVMSVSREIRAQLAVARFLSSVLVTGEEGAATLAEDEGLRFAESGLQGVSIDGRGVAGFEDQVKSDLLKIARAEAFLDEEDRLLDRIAASGQDVEIRPAPDGINRAVPWDFDTDTRAINSGVRPFNLVSDPAQANFMMGDTPVYIDPDAAGAPCGSIIYFDPSAATEGTPSDAILYHELGHSANFADGTGYGMAVPTSAWPGGPSLLPDGTYDPSQPIPAWAQQWHSQEEFNNVAQENLYRAQRGYPPRPDYATLP
jgi:uncharacterized Zn-binding protein involved in type VI secretion